MGHAGLVDLERFFPAYQLAVWNAGRTSSACYAHGSTYAVHQHPLGSDHSLQTIFKSQCGTHDRVERMAMYKFWSIYGTKENEYIFLTPTAKCATEDDVREWVAGKYPNMSIKEIVDEGGDAS